MRNYIKNFAIRARYKKDSINEFDFDLEDGDDLTDEIEKSLLEIKKAWNIPSDEIKAAIKSRKLSKKNARR